MCYVVTLPTGTWLFMSTDLLAAFRVATRLPGSRVEQWQSGVDGALSIAVVEMPRPEAILPEESR